MIRARQLRPCSAPSSQGARGTALLNSGPANFCKPYFRLSFHPQMRQLSPHALSPPVISSPDSNKQLLRSPADQQCFTKPRRPRCLQCSLLPPFSFIILFQRGCGGDTKVTGCAAQGLGVEGAVPACRVQPEKPFLAVTALPFSRAEGPTTAAPCPLASLHPQSKLAASSVLQ